MCNINQSDIASEMKNGKVIKEYTFDTINPLANKNCFIMFIVSDNKDGVYSDTIKCISIDKYGGLSGVGRWLINNTKYPLNVDTLIMNGSCDSINR